MNSLRGKFWQCILVKVPISTTPWLALILRTAPVPLLGPEKLLASAGRSTQSSQLARLGLRAAP